MIIEIPSRFTECVLFTADVPESVSAAYRVRVALEIAARICANLGGANLRDANLSYATLIGANLGGANLRDANLSYATLIGANLGGVNLSGAILNDANLSGANLHEANLSRAYLSGANLDGADLRGATIRDGIQIFRQPLQVSGLYYPAIIYDAHMQIGCEFHSLADWAAFDEHRIAEMDDVRAVNFWRSYKESLLALAKADGRET